MCTWNTCLYLGHKALEILERLADRNLSEIESLWSEDEGEDPARTGG